MSSVLSVSAPFPCILWWAFVYDADTVCFDHVAHYQKMSYRNRYYIAGANGVVNMSIPLVNGRNQRVAMSEVQIHNKERWQIQQWRTIVSAYKRSPFFEFYEPALEPLFFKPCDNLAEFNLASIEWLKAQLNISFLETFTNDYQKSAPDGVPDIRESLKPGAELKPNNGFPEYYQVFADRNGFHPNLSILDLLFAEGPHAKDWLRTNKDAIIKWHLEQ